MTERIRRLLIVEDEFLIRLTLSEVLRDEGYEVLEAESGDEAARLLDGDPRIDVLLTDVQLPGSFDGRSLAARARQIRADFPVIFMTGRPDSVEPSGGREMFVAKPYLPSEICAAVRRILE